MTVDLLNEKRPSPSTIHARRPEANLIDTHCHLDDESFAGDVEEVVARAMEAGVSRIIVPAIDRDNTGAVLALTTRFEGVFGAIGIHPNSAADWQDEWLPDLRSLALHPKVVAIGEIGLDYYWDKTPPTIQRRAFDAQLMLAAELSLPVIIHNREAGTDVIEQLAASTLNGRDRAGVLHSFSGDWGMAEAALGMGFYLGFTGPLTYKKADQLREIASRAPLDRVLIETDAPYLTPHPFRGRRNEPAYVSLVAERLADLRGLPLEDIARITTANAETLFTFPSGTAKATVFDTV